MLTKLFQRDRGPLQATVALLLDTVACLTQHSLEAAAQTRSPQLADQADQRRGSPRFRRRTVAVTASQIIEKRLDLEFNHSQLNFMDCFRRQVQEWQQMQVLAYRTHVPQAT